MMQTDNHNFRINVATDKKYILRKISMKFQNSKFGIWYKIAFYIVFVINWNSLKLRGQWGTIISGWIKLYASVS